MICVSFYQTRRIHLSNYRNVTETLTHCCSKDCRTCRVLTPKDPTYSPERKEEILRIYQERSSMRGVEQSIGVSRHTLSPSIKKICLSLSIEETHRRDFCFRQSRRMSWNWIKSGHLYFAAAINASCGQHNAGERGRDYCCRYGRPKHQNVSAAMGVDTGVLPSLPHLQ